MMAIVHWYESGYFMQDASKIPVKDVSNTPFKKHN